MDPDFMFIHKLCRNRITDEKGKDPGWLFYTKGYFTIQLIPDLFKFSLLVAALPAVISLYFAGIYDEEETIKRLLPQKLRDQYVFRSELALQKLIFVKAVTQ